MFFIVKNFSFLFWRENYFQNLGGMAPCPPLDPPMESSNFQGPKVTPLQFETSPNLNRRISKQAIIFRRKSKEKILQGEDMAPVDLLDFDLIFAPQRIGLLRTKPGLCEYVPKCHASVRHTTRSSRPEWLYSAAQPGRAVTTAPRHMTRPEQFNAGSGSGRSAVTAHNSPQAWLFLLSAAACGMTHLWTVTRRP